MLYKRPFFIIRFLFMKHIIDIDTWERRDNYGFFRTFLNSWYSVTTEIDCTEASAAAKQSGHSFFLYYLYAVLRSANEVDELRSCLYGNGVRPPRWLKGEPQTGKKEKKSVRTVFQQHWPPYSQSR